MAVDRRCPQCGRLLQAGEAVCRACKWEGPGETRRAEAVLLASLLLLTVLFVISAFAARLYHAKEAAFGQQWSALGQKDLKAGQPNKAIVDFRTALVYCRDNEDYELRLAQALLKARHEDEARAYLTRLWEREPENAVVNLELGRLAARNGNVEETLRYFHSAIYGNWEGQDSARLRRETRLELYRFLMSEGAKPQAQGELEALAAEVPLDPELHAQVGELFFGAAEYELALKQFREALQVNRNEKAALVGTAEADFRLGNYHDAQPYLERALRKDPHNTQLAQMLEMTDLVLSTDPEEPHLTAAERSARVVRAFDQALSRMEECARTRSEGLRVPEPQTALQGLYQQAMAMKAHVRLRVLTRNPDLLTSAMKFVEEAENLTASYCGAPTGLDQALLLIARKHGGNQK